jgi:hypothetical protein
LCAGGRMSATAKGPQKGLRLSCLGSPPRRSILKRLATRQQAAV